MSGRAYHCPCALSFRLTSTSIDLYASRAKFEIFLEQYVQHKCETDHDRLKDYVKKNAEELKPIIEVSKRLPFLHKECHMPMDVERGGDGRLA